MRITSTKLVPKRSRTEPATGPVAGLILAAPEMKFEPGGPEIAASGRFPGGMYVFPTGSESSNPLAAEIAGLAKTFSVQLASQLHPHLGTGVRAGWIVLGAISLLDRAKTENVPWHEIALDGGTLAVEALTATNSALPNELRLDVGWAEGTALLLEATKHAAQGGETGEFVIEKALDQSTPVELARRLFSIALAAQTSGPVFGPMRANPIDVTVNATSERRIA